MHSDHNNNNNINNNNKKKKIATSLSFSVTGRGLIDDMIAFIFPGTWVPRAEVTWSNLWGVKRSSNSQIPSKEQFHVTLCNMMPSTHSVIPVEI